MTWQFKKWFSTSVIMTALVLIATPALASHPYAQWADEFGIDMNASYDGTRVMEMKDGTFEFIEHKAPGKMYTEVNIGNMTSGTLIREDLGKSYLLMPSMGMYRETSLNDALMQSSNGLKFKSIERTGYDTVLGFPSIKYKARFQDKDGKGAGHVWVTDSGIPIKMEMIYSNKDVKGLRMKMEFIELNLRQQDPAIFELNPNLKPMSMGGLGGLFGSGGQQPGAGGANSSLSDLLNGAAGSGGLESLQGMLPGSAAPAQAAPAAKSSAPASTSTNMSRQLTTDNMTQSVQLHLQYLGIDPGNTSGELSLDTQIAISEFQASKGMKATGKVSPQLLGVLSAEVDSGK